MKHELIRRTEELERALETLNSEFVGLEKVISEIKDCITPWWVTREILEKPVVVSLWGMTGTGKSSLVRRLTELLGIDKRCITIDCLGSMADGKTILTAFENSFGAESTEVKDMADLTRNSVIILDEFQHIRTINENGEEVEESESRGIWNLLDDGIIRGISGLGWVVSTVVEYYVALSEFSKDNPGIKLYPGLKIKDLAGIEAVNSSIRFKSELEEDSYRVGTSDEDSENIRDEEINVLPARVKRNMLRSLGGRDHLVSDLLGSRDLQEYTENFKIIIEELTRPKNLDCSNSLIFTIGNLDEAYLDATEVSPDIDADLFFNETERITSHDIKTALLKRFRAEQVARFGNNLIKYPVFSKSGFQEIISRETDRIISRFKDISGVTVTVTKDFKDFIYSESVFPAQGARPVVSSVNTMISPILSKISILASESAEIGIVDPEKGYMRSNIKYYVKLGDTGEIIEHESPVNLGNLRDPKKSRNLIIKAVHEIGHAILTSWCTGEVPKVISANTVDKGGVCHTGEDDREIKTVKEIRDQVKIYLAGRAAETLVFPEELRLAGSASDLQGAWDTLSTEYYDGGMWNLGDKKVAPALYSSYVTQNFASNIPGGLDSAGKLESDLKKEFDNLWNETLGVLETEKGILKEASEKICETGVLTGEEFKKIIESHGNKLTLEKLKETSEYLSKENFLRLFYYGFN